MKPRIYIPLCFYFIAFSTAATRGKNPIYIPLCFYFIENLLGDKVDTYQFTFHYASTLSSHRHPQQSAPSYLHSTMLLLYLAICTRVPPVTGHLHSTMLLLYPEKMVLKFRYINIYIPLCFYFIDNLVLSRRQPSGIYIPLCFYFIKGADLGLHGFQ